MAASQMWDTTKRTITENNTVTLQLAKVSQHGLQLLQENEHLRSVQGQLSQELELLEGTQRTMAKQSILHKKVPRGPEPQHSGQGIGPAHSRPGFHHAI